MAENSRFWETTGTGDGPLAGYSMAEFYDFLRKLLTTDQEATQGVLRGVGSELAVSGSASPLAVADGAAMVYGLFYENSAALNLTVTTPVTGTTGGRVNLKADWTAQTVRAMVQMSPDGTASIPALVQSAGSEWSIPLATFTVTIGGTITLTDARSYCRFANYIDETDLDFITGLSVIGNPSSSAGASQAIAASADGQVLRRAGGSIGFGTIGSGSIDDGAITDAKLRDSAARSVIGRAAGTPGAPADIVAGADNTVLARSGGAVAFQALTAAMIGNGAIGTAQLANDAVDDTKAGNRVVQMRRRQGGDGSDWSYAGPWSYTPGAVRMQCGRDTITFSNETSKAKTITFPEAFSAPPIVIVQVYGEGKIASAQITIHATTGFYFTARVNVALTGNLYAEWLAIGPE